MKKNNIPIQLYFVETDHLGSILSLYNENGQQTYEQSFDAPALSFVEGLGRKRNPTYRTFSPPFEGGAGGGKPEWLIRGYTGHEHCDEFGLINMNGRMYEPILGRMPVLIILCKTLPAHKAITDTVIVGIIL